MSDTIDDFRLMKLVRDERRKIYGIPCPTCLQERPRGCPTLLLPQQRCRVDRYRDPRPRIAEEQEQALFDAILAQVPS